jgi:hypothetical protein
MSVLNTVGHIRADLAGWHVWSDETVTVIEERDIRPDVLTVDATERGLALIAGQMLVSVERTNELRDHVSRLI